MKYYKAFNKGMTCRGKKYEAGKEYEEEGREICAKGMMHFCETPFDTLDYYPLVDKDGEFSEYAEVEPLDKVKKAGNKCASRKIRIRTKLSFQEFIKAGVDSIIEETNKRDTDTSDYTCIKSADERARIGNSNNLAKIGSFGDGSKIGNSGNKAHIGSTGFLSKIGDIGNETTIVNSGELVQIGSAGDFAQIGSSGNDTKIGSSGDSAEIGSSGDNVRIGSSGNDAQIGSSGNGTDIGSSGYWARIGSSGNKVKIGSSGFGAKIRSFGNEARIGSSGDVTKIKMSGVRSVAAAVGDRCAISGKKGDWIVLAEWKIDEEGEFYPACVKAGKIDGETLKEDTMYTLIGGEFVAQT